MKIVSMEITGYRSLRDFKIDFDDLIVLVGKNDAGKSSVLRAIEFIMKIFAGKSGNQFSFEGSPTHSNSFTITFRDVFDFRPFFGNKEGKIVANLTFDFSEEEWNSILGRPPRWIINGQKIKSIDAIGAITFKCTITGSIKPPEIIADMDEIVSDKGVVFFKNQEGNNELRLSYDVNSKAFNLSQAGDFSVIHRLSEFLTGEFEHKSIGKPRERFHIISAERDLPYLPKETIQPTISPKLEDMKNIPKLVLSAQTTQLAHRRTDLQEIKNDFARLFPDYGDFKAMENNEHMIEFYIGEHRSDQTGSGAQQTFSSVFGMDFAKTDIIGIEEPEIHLHPQKQREFMRFLMEMTEKKDIQLIITTHSPSIVAEAPISSLRLIKREKGKTTASHVSATSLIEIGEELGVTVRDTLEYEAILLVEGKIDEAYFGRAIELFSQDSPSNKRIVSLGMGGWNKTETFVQSKYISKLKRPYLVIFDGDIDKIEKKKIQKDNYLKECDCIDKSKIRILSRLEIENYFAVPAAISRAFPNFKSDDITRAMNGYESGENLKNILMQLFESQSEKGFRTEDAIKIIKEIKKEEIPEEIKNIVLEINRETEI